MSNINKMFALYLKKMGLHPDKMPRIQLVETRRAFMGGLASLIVGIIDAETEDKTIDLLDAVGKELEDYWTRQALQYDIVNPPPVVRPRSPRDN